MATLKVPAFLLAFKRFCRSLARFFLAAMVRAVDLDFFGPAAIRVAGAKAKPATNANRNKNKFLPPLYLDLMSPPRPGGDDPYGGASESCSKELMCSRELELS